jgi:outer membrane protein assembly factor BamB
VTPGRRSVAVLLLLCATAGCESLFGGANPEVPLWAKHPNGAIRVFIHRRLTAVERVTGETYERGRPEIDPAHNRVYVGSSDWGLYALDARDGSPVWRFETRGPVQSAPLYDRSEGALYFGSNDGALYKVAASDGRLVWRFMTNAEVSRRPVLAFGNVYAVNANDTLMAIDAASGKLRWSQHRSPAFGMEIAGHAGALVTNERVYVGFSDGHVAAYDPTNGAERWPPVDLAGDAEQTLGEAPRYLDVDTTPVLGTTSAGSVIYVASYAGGVTALASDTGARVWVNERTAGVTDIALWTQAAHRPSDGVGPDVEGRAVLVAASGATGLWGLSPEDGRQLWRRDLPEGGISEPVPIEGALLVSTTRYGLFLVSPLDGGLIDGIGMSGGLAMVPAVFGGRAYVLSNEGTFLGVQVVAPRKM